MKKLVLITACILLAGFTFGQTLKKGEIVAVNSYSFTLNPDVTMNQFRDFYLNKYIPEYEKNYHGVKVFLLNGDRGEKKNQLGALILFESAAVRNKYYPIENDTTMSAAVKAAEEKMKPVNDEMNKLVIDGSRVYTDWLIK
jgi:hypothetical protein